VSNNVYVRSEVKFVLVFSGPDLQGQSPSQRGTTWHLVSEWFYPFLLQWTAVEVRSVSRRLCSLQMGRNTQDLYLLINLSCKDKHISSALLREPVRVVTTSALTTAYFCCYSAPGLQSRLFLHRFAAGETQHVVLKFPNGNVCQQSTCAAC
jgi:hypothetical protein